MMKNNHFTVPAIHFGKFTGITGSIIIQIVVIVI